ncbi:MAG: divergent polysaccharide deacetylase family protein [Deltaproteobacteria bacterium]|nr:divergent polysaccharide deacetylase family protein [Deltaproteobacteria bacterium]
MPKREYAGPPRIAIIIDDIGFRDVLETQFIEIPEAITLSFLPHTPYGQNLARRATIKGKEVMAHLPMEAIEPANRPGRGGLFVRMTPSEIRQLTSDGLDWVPGISGVNNHMGSRFTQDEDKMALVMDLVKKKNLYFIDSRTIGASRAYAVAHRLGVPAAVRNVFLDHDPETDKILHQFDVLAAVAKRQGVAIAIGHPNNNTLGALRRKLPDLARDGIRVVPPSSIVR